MYLSDFYCFESDFSLIPYFIFQQFCVQSRCSGLEKRMLTNEGKNAIQSPRENLNMLIRFCMEPGVIVSDQRFKLFPALCEAYLWMKFFSFYNIPCHEELQITKITTANTVEGEFSPSSWAPPRQNRKFINHVKSNLFPY